MKNYKTVISLMSGTSVDTVDACLVKIFGDLKFEIVNSYSMSYPDEIREKILELANGNANIRDVCYMNFVIGELFAKCVNLLLKKSNFNKENVDFISSHGQTVCHIPENIEIGSVSVKSTLQIGDISVISQRTGIMTVGDFRTKDMAAGGQGAPLVPFADKILFGTDKNRLIQNIGGISNVTVISKDCDIFAFDNGPGNMLIDYFVNKLFNVPYDKDGEIALKGSVDYNWLNILMNEPYYLKKPPKTTGRELFNNEYAQKIYKTAPKNKYDVVSTITNLTAKVISDSYKNFVFPKTSVDEAVIGGGGAYNSAIKKYLSEYLPNLVIKTHDDFNIPNKFKECLAFAYLGYFTLLKQPNNIPSCTGASYPVVMGKISY